MVNNGLEHLVPFQHEDFQEWTNAEDMQRTLLEYTANLFTDLAEDNLLKTVGKRTICIAIAGGGCKNKFLMERIEDLMQIPKDELLTAETWGVESEWVEAIGFAYLAFLRLNEISVNLSKITGSNGNILLGEISFPNFT